jgi:site-specific DNA-adenine methylase
MAISSLETAKHIHKMKGKSINLTNSQYKKLLRKISQRYIAGQAQALRYINEAIIDTNWNIGQYIVEFEQQGGH